MSLCLSIMQPYLFPYIGYYYLIQRSDLHVILDDVNFIKKGFINRNSIMGTEENKDVRFNLKINKISQNKLISEHTVFHENYDLINFMQTKLRNVDPDLISSLIMLIRSSENANLVDVLQLTILELNKHLGIHTPIIRSSDLKSAKDLSGTEKILQICKSLGASHYINLPGGRLIYRNEVFQEKNLQLQFVDLTEIEHCFPKGVSIYQSILGLLNTQYAASVFKALDR